MVTGPILIAFNHIRMKKKLLYLIGVCNVLFTGVSCSSSFTSNLPMVKGKAHEMVIATDLILWEGPAGDTLRKVFGAPVPGLPQDEPYFSMIQKDPLGFSRSSLFREHRNVCRIRVEDSLKNEILVSENVWATPQLVLDIHATSPDSLISLLQREKQLLRMLIKQKEIRRNLDIHHRSINLAIRDSLEKGHGILLTVPRGFTLDVNKKNFVWISMDIDRENVQLGLLIWHYPYLDEQQFTKEGLIRQRNLFLEAHVPGPVEGSYMTTDTLNYETIYEPVMYRDKYYVWLRGLWYTENYAMGGPFVSLSTLHEKTGEIITVEAFVYAPQRTKRNYIRQLESVVSSLRVSFTPEDVDSVTVVPSYL